MHGLHAFGMVKGMVIMPMAWSLCLCHGRYAFVMVTMPLAWSPSLWYGHHAFGMVTLPLTWSLCMVFMPLA